MDTKILIPSTFAGLLQLILCTFSLILMVPEVGSGRMSVGLYISLFGILNSIIASIAEISYNRLSELASQIRYLKEFNQYLELSKTPGALDPMSEITTPFKQLEIINVSFSYPGTEKLVLDNVSLTIEAGGEGLGKLGTALER